MVKEDIYILSEENYKNEPEEAQKESGKNEPDKAVTFATQSDLDSFVDKRIAKALETSRAKWEEEYNGKIEKAKTEAQELAKLSEKERQEKLLLKREEELSQRENSLRQKEYRLEATKQLKERGLGVELVDLVLSGDPQKTMENIETLQKFTSLEVTKRVDELSNRKAPKESNAINLNGKRSKLLDFANENRLI